ncbi:MAG: hypothetical protein B6242_16880 [Anaerolineaceae bacterium 4572_78]|nr:MAG: hypothetical protein B6242_16880 [Anaerolineaceae bacterium 4572_78]
MRTPNTQAESPDVQPVNPEVQREITSLFTTHGYEEMIHDAVVPLGGTCLKKGNTVVRIAPHQDSPSGLEIGVSDGTERSRISKLLGGKGWQDILASNGKFRLGAEIPSTVEGSKSKGYILEVNA